MRLAGLYENIERRIPNGNEEAAEGTERSGSFNRSSLTIPSSFGARRARYRSAPKNFWAKTIPIAIAGTKMRASIRSAPRLASDGPGQKPPSPQPTPKIAEPINSWRSIGEDAADGSLRL